jgi:hypothetical protein
MKVNRENIIVHETTSAVMLKSTRCDSHCVCSRLVDDRSSLEEPDIHLSFFFYFVSDRSLSFSSWVHPTFNPSSLTVSLSTSWLVISKFNLPFHQNLSPSLSPPRTGLCLCQKFPQNPTFLLLSWLDLSFLPQQYCLPFYSSSENFKNDPLMNRRQLSCP